MTHYLANLRHAYAQLKAGKVQHQAMFADGLIAPAIRAIECDETAAALRAAQDRIVELEKALEEALDAEGLSGD